MACFTFIIKNGKHNSLEIIFETNSKLDEPNSKNLKYTKLTIQVVKLLEIAV